MKNLKTWKARLALVGVLFALGLGAVFSTTTGTNRAQQALLELFCDACGQPSTTSLRDLVASTVTLSDSQTITGAKTFTAAPTFNGAITTAKGLPVLLAKGGIPLIGLSSGSISAPGAISGITALPVAYPDAFCYVPANAVATVAAAGYYYCQFTTTTAGTICLNTYTSGVPTIPAGGCTPVTDGKGAFTGDTGEEFGPTITLPANSLGANGAARIALGSAQTNNANVKTLRLRWSTSAGTIFVAQPVTSTVASGMVATISNTGTAAKNLSTVQASFGAAPTTVGVLGTIDSTASTTLVLSQQRATATDNVVILPPTFEVLSDGT